MWSLKSFNMPIKSSPTVVASAVLVGAITVLASPLHSSQEAIARAATRAAAVATDEARTQAILMEKLVTEPLPAAGSSAEDRAGIRPLIRSFRLGVSAEATAQDG